jgi:hypothetical protein
MLTERMNATIFGPTNLSQVFLVSIKSLSKFNAHNSDLFLLNTPMDEYTRICECKITLSGGEIIHGFERKFTKPGPSDRLIPDFHFNKTDEDFMNINFCPTPLYFQKI